MRMLNLPATTILILLPALILGACQLVVPTAQVNEVTFTVADYAFVGPQSLPAPLAAASTTRAGNRFRSN